MKKENIYIDLRKCTEEQIKSLVPTLEKHGYNVYFHDRIFLKNGKYDKPYFHLFNSKSWLSSSILVTKQELTYPEFIKLFEGGEIIKGNDFQPLFNHLHEEHGLILQVSEMQEIIRIVNELNSNK